MRKHKWSAIVAGGILAAVAAIGLTACGSSANVNENYLVLTNVNKVTCNIVDDATATVADLQQAADFVANADSREAQAILDRNPELDNLQPLTDALNAKITTIKACPAAGESSVSSPSPSPTADTPALSDELKALLDASSVPMIDCVSVVEETGGVTVDDTYPLFVKTFLDVDAKDASLRKWSDALSTPLKGKTPEKMHQWLNRAICEEPLVGVSLAHLFAHLEVSGVSILSLQSTDWLKPYAVDANQIDELTAQFVPLEVWKLQNPGKSPSNDQYVEALNANHDYQALASKLVFLLSRYQLAGVKSINSTHHYHLVAGGLRADGIPPVEVSTAKDTYPSLVFYLTEKTACKPISVLAFNTGDKRPMLGDIPDSCVKKPTTECKKNCTPPPKCKTNCTPPPCPPGQVKNKNHVCVVPKSSDPKDYPYPTGKPPVTANPTPQKTPDPVETSKPGGSGVTDTPTKNPGSETGVQAPNTTPAPSTSTPPPPNEGGSNGAGDPGGF